MMEPPEIGWSEIARYLGNEMTAAERDRFERTIAESPDHAALVREAGVVWQQAGRMPHTDNFDPAEALARIKRAPPAVSTPSRPSRRWIFATVPAVAAAAAAVVAIVIGRDRKPPTPPVPWTELVTKRAQRAELRLPEGTR